MIFQNNLSKILALTFFFGLVNHAYCQENEVTKPLLAKDVVHSVLTNYPKILSYYEKVEAAQGSYLASQGFFDVRLKQEYQDKTRGFYDGKLSDSSIEKQNQFLGSKIYGGYRKSNGNFAEYDGGSLTNNDGEIRAGIKFSLLKDSSIDQNRLGLMLADLGIKEGKVQLENIKIEMQRDALKSYWNWVVLGKIYKIHQDLLELALKREVQLEARLAKGDVAEIVVVENKKNILRRKTAAQESKTDFENSAIYLSLFLRDKEGKPIAPKEESIPEIEFILTELDAQKYQQNLENALSQRAEVKVIKIKKEEELGHLKYAKNLLRPSLDVDFGASKDLGRGPQSRSQTNNFVKLEFGMPLQFSEARGKISSAESKLSALKYEEQLLQDQIKAEIEQLKNNISNSIELYKNLKEEVHFAQTLENAEREKFKHGASNFFLVNMREQDTASAKATQLMMFKKYQNSLANYKAAIFSFE